LLFVTCAEVEDALNRLKGQVSALGCAAERHPAASAPQIGELASYDCVLVQRASLPLVHSC
jgi:hypothetical protein